MHIDDKERRAARAALKRAYKRKTRRNGILNILFVPFAAVLIIACIVSIAMDKSELSDKQAELAVLESRAQELRTQNAGYQSILDEEDERTYMERIAIEKLGYAYPNERRFYDTTRN